MKTHILVVEDEVLIADDIQRSLEALGYEAPEPASSPQEALEKVAAQPPDLLLMDVDLGAEMDGIELVNRLRAIWSGPVIYLTAHTSPRTLERAKVTTPFGYIVKPFKDRELHATIEMALYKHRTESHWLQFQEKWHKIPQLAEKIHEFLAQLENALLTSWPAPSEARQNIQVLVHQGRALAQELQERCEQAQGSLQEDLKKT